MKRLRRSIGIGAALSLLLLGAPTAGAAAAQGDPPPPQQTGQGEEHAADPAELPTRAKPTTPAASPAPQSNARSRQVTCGQVITQNTVLRNDVGPCSGDGIVIGADNITLNLNGHKVLGNNDKGAGGEFAGIRLPRRTGVTVTGRPGGQTSGQMATVSRFEAGVVINGGSANTVEDLAVTDNIGIDDAFNAELGDGIVIFDSPSNRLLNNVVVGNGIFDGIGVLGPESDNTTIQGNTVTDTVGPSDGGPAGQGVIVNGADFAAELISGTNTRDNIVRKNASAGLANINVVDANIVNNTVEDNGLTNDRGNGIGLSTGPGVGFQPTRVLIEGNQIHGNGADGISIVFAQENRILNNNAADNAVLNNINDDVYGAYYDLHEFTVGFGPGSCANDWFGNIWGSGYYYPACTTTGGSGPPFPVRPEGPPGDPTCRDGIDNEQDGLTDFLDPDCQAPPEGPIGDPTCSDGVDNDLDGFADGEDDNCGGDGGFGFGDGDLGGGLGDGGLGGDGGLEDGGLLAP